jgi:tRNA modification GTPase
MQTIVAQSTAAGKAGVAIIRISGEKAKDVFSLLGCTVPEARKASLQKLKHPKTNDIIDEALLLWFPAPHSFTGEDVVELHTHGSRAILSVLLDVLCAYAHFRLAEAGEFSRRAFENDRMDLTQIEGLADLIEAETAMQHRQAIRQMQGELETLYEGWRHQLVSLLARMEAYIDFPDEELPESLYQEILSTFTQLGTQLETHMGDDRGEVIRKGIFITILGAPNAGKSTLLNFLAKRDVAIVSHIAGTTRDVLEVQMDLGGFPVTLCDTAGIRDSTDVIEVEGIKRARSAALDADLRIIVIDGSTWPKHDEALLQNVAENDLILLTKKDLNDALPEVITLNEGEATALSITNGAGVDLFLEKLLGRLEALYGATADPLFTRARHKSALTEARTHLERAQDVLSQRAPIELAAEDLRLAARSIGTITGKIDLEEILDEIFSSFCIGK